jgi:DNA-binding transcriptional ArsR family regulator
VTTIDLVPVLAALGDESRWRVLEALGEGDASASALAGSLPISRQAIAKHLGVLREAGLVEPVRSGREVQYRVLGAHLRDTASRLDAIGAAWDRRLSVIREIAERPEQAPGSGRSAD